MAAVLFIYFTKEFQQSSLRDSFGAWDWAVVAWVVYSLSTAYWVRKKWPTPAAKAGRTPISPQKRWELIQIVSYASALNAVLAGFVARVGLGSPRWFSYLLYGIGIVLLFMFEPTDPVMDDARNASDKEK